MRRVPRLPAALAFAESRARRPAVAQGDNHCGPNDPLREPASVPDELLTAVLREQQAATVSAQLHSRALAYDVAVEELVVAAGRPLVALTADPVL